MRPLVLILLGLISIHAQANSNVRFTNRELQAAFVLIRPELNSLQVDGRTGVFKSAPALKFFGLEDQTFEVSFKGIINLADIQFNHLVGKMPVIQFQNGALELAIPIEDQNAVIKTRLGSIGVSGAKLVAILGWARLPSGRQELVLQSARLDGSLSATGILNSASILKKIRELFIRTLTEQVSALLVKPEVQDAVEKGLLGWAKFYTGIEFHSLVPESIRFFSQGIVSGIEFEAQ